MKYVSNAFSLQMQGDHECLTTPASREAAMWELSPVHQGDSEAKSKYWGTGPLQFPAKSVIGHADICSVINSDLGLSGEAAYQMNRTSIKLEPGDILWVGQYVGPRLPEGATELPEGATIRWYKVTCVKQGTLTRQEQVMKELKEFLGSMEYKGFQFDDVYNDSDWKSFMIAMSELHQCRLDLTGDE